MEIAGALTDSVVTVQLPLRAWAEGVLNTPPEVAGAAAGAQATLMVLGPQLVEGIDVMV
ncbi:hypothetical protein HX867_32040 [Pseudomonas gingeri]|nr:hypothetical protein [Pseudomonas gingeri]NVZ75426.1 hypothetical protein [Pseudomonas gingeri]NWA11203.1 hypothetical protein [Pseudomonas gingeri]